jgi:group I intron endonuclease
MGIVYKVTNKIDGTSYIGSTRQTLKRRRQQHEYRSSNPKDCPFHTALREWGLTAFEWDVLCEVVDAQLNEAEAQHIAEARKVGRSLYNLSSGVSRSGVSASPETRARLSRAMQGNKSRAGKSNSTEHRAKISAALKGRTSPMKGRRLSDKHKSKISAAKQRKRNHDTVINQG